LPLWLMACCLLATARAQSPLAAPVLPDGLGVNIHFTDPKPGEMEMLAAGGFRWVRMDLGWGATERVKGQYDFSRYDRLIEALQPHGIRALLILDYSNKHYDGGLSPCSDEGRRAFARWAAAAVTRFRGRGVLWEMYNEPNIKFWKPEPKVEDYVKLALEVGRAIRAVAPDELYMGPATSGIKLPFLEACFKAGLLEYWCAVLVHPYRHTGPETAAAEYAALRRLIAQYAPPGKTIPILSGEWGYSAASNDMDETKQGKMLPRQWLVNLSNDVPLSIWYDWHDDGPDPKEKEHHFGTVFHPYFQDRQPVYDPKPAYLAAQALTRSLAGFRFNKRLHVGSDEDYVLLFDKGEAVRLAAWTTANEEREAVIPASPGRFQVVSHVGQALPAAMAGAEGLKLTLNDTPQYLMPEGPNDALRLAAAWDRAPLEIHRPGGQLRVDLGVTNPLPRAIQLTTSDGREIHVAPGVRLTTATKAMLVRRFAPLPLTPTLIAKGLPRIAQRVEATATNPLALAVGVIGPGAVSMVVDNPSGDPFAGKLLLKDITGLALQESPMPVTLRQGQTRAPIQFACQPGSGKARFGAQLLDDDGQQQVELPVAAYVPIDDFSRYDAEGLAAAYRLAADGDRKVVSEQSLSLADPPPGGPESLGRCLKIEFRMEFGWKFLRLAPQRQAAKAIEGRPKALAMWVCVDSNALSPRVRFVDATGQYFQPTGPALKDKGWQHLVIDLSRVPPTHWGGANDGTIHEPILWNTLLLLDKFGREAVYQGTVHVAAPMLLY